jgi:CBS domain-containing protein
VNEIMEYGATTVPGRECQSRDESDDAHRVRHILVLRGGELAGIVSIGDVVKLRLEGLELETNVLRDAIQCRALRARELLSSTLNDPGSPLTQLFF